MINPRDMNKISYDQSWSRDTVVLYMALRVDTNASYSSRV